MIDSIREFWTDVWEIDAARWLIYAAVTTALILVGVYVGKLFRNMAIGVESDSIDYMAGFEKMKDDGKLDEREFDQLRTTLSNRVLTDHGLPAECDEGESVDESESLDEAKEPENE